MPIKHRLERTRPETANELTRLLAREWAGPSPEGQPLIILEGGSHEPLHIYVLWDKWEGLSQTDRSEIIMDVVESVGLPAVGVSPDSPVTVAMGLTTAEARRMGIQAT